MLVEQFRTGGDRNFGYLVSDDGSRLAAVIDPSYSPDTIVEFARQHGLSIVHAFDTHGHGDHTNGDERFAALTGVRPLLFGAADPHSGKVVGDGTAFALGNLAMRIIHVPGHSPDSICILVGDALFTGDTLFVGKVGGTDFEDGARLEYESLHRQLLALPDETRVFPGHDVGVAPTSTIGHERATNPFLLQPDFASFLALKRNWAAYKLEHGIA
ncbi:MAG: MBL fold metallo-hydrolase [Anaerolineae bacterium]